MRQKLIKSTSAGMGLISVPFDKLTLVKNFSSLHN